MIPFMLNAQNKQIWRDRKEVKQLPTTGQGKGDMGARGFRVSLVE